MAGRGPAPKDPSEVRRRNAAPKTELVVPDDELRGPELPEGIDWPDATLDWWETWRKSPQAQTFTDTDWSFLLDTAMLHMQFWDGNYKAGSELRLRVAKFGATPEDRARLRISIGQPGPTGGAAPAKKSAAPAPRTKRATANRKGRILKAVDGGGEG